jgi:hypothetical protein
VIASRTARGRYLGKVLPECERTHVHLLVGRS